MSQSLRTALIAMLTPGRPPDGQSGDDPGLWPRRLNDFVSYLESGDAEPSSPSGDGLLECSIKYSSVIVGDAQSMSHYS
jgi:hypothetical protein